MSDETGVVFYVSNNGDDCWSGTLPSPNETRTDGPFASLRRARDAIRVLRSKEGMKAPVAVKVRGGKYFLSETLVLGSEDSGAPDCPVTYTSYQREHPTISGGWKVTEWKPYQGGILRSELPGARGGKWRFRQLFCNGERQRRARWPKFEPRNPLYGGWALMEGPAEPGSTIAFKFRPDTFRRRWAKPDEVEISYFGFYGWSMSTVPVKSIDYENRVITLAHGGYQFDVPPWYTSCPFMPDNRFYVENALEELDQPGEWCFDSEEGVLYFWPPDGSIEDAEVVVPALSCLVDMSGASWVRISGFTFTETADGDNFHHEGMEGCGAMFPRVGWRYCGDAIHLKNVEHCSVEGNHFYEVGGNAIYLESYNARNLISSNEIAHAGACGVCLVGSRLKHPIFNEVSDNHIHHCGVFNKYSAGVFAGMSDGNMIEHNLIEHLPHHGINLSNSPYGRNSVEYNQIRHVCQEVHDNGAINCWMEHPGEKGIERCGHIIRFNHISDCYGCEVVGGEVSEGKSNLSKATFTNGIYLDNYTSNCIIYGNVIARCANNGVVVHGGKNNVIENNIIVDCLANVRFQDYVSSWAGDYWKGMAGFMTGNLVTHNIFYQSDPEAPVFYLHAWTDRVVARSDYNLFFQKAGGKYTLGHDAAQDVTKIGSLDEWKRAGHDRNSILADPMFEDMEQDDYQLRPESPAFKLGFVPIDFRKLGPRKNR